jgi:hypothetical protein
MNEENKKNLKGCGALILIGVVAFILLGIILKSCGNDCINCGGDGVLTISGMKTSCPKCHPSHRDWSNPK